MTPNEQALALGGRSASSPPPSKQADPTQTSARQRALEYAELKRVVKERGLLEKQPVYYTLRVLVNLSLLALSILFLVRVDNFALQLLDAFLMAFAFVQIAFVGHNSGHRQVGTKAWHDDVLTLTHFGLLLGTSATWWVDKHNDHHGHPNVQDLDPDIDFPMLAFSEEQVASKQGLARLIVTYQAFFFPLMITLITYGMRWHSLRKLASGTVRRPVLEAVMMALHFVWYFALLFYALDNGWQVLLFVMLHQALIGVYLASVFAANHKGMPVLDKDEEPDFLRLQVITSRNIYGHPLTDFLYGGLNYQIEHHLFPTMPQNKLREAQGIIKEFCHAHNIPYHETNFVQSQKEVLQHLHHVSAPLRMDLASQGAGK